MNVRATLSKTLFGFLLLIPAMSFSFYDEESVEGVSLIEDENVDILANGDSVMIFSKRSGRLLKWIGPAGNAILDACPECTDNFEELHDGGGGAVAGLGGSDDPPIRLYLLKKIYDPGDNDPFGKQQMLVCGISEYDILDYTYSRTLEGAWFHQIWTIYEMNGSKKYANPSTSGMYNGQSTVGNECEFKHLLGQKVLTVHAYTGNTLSGFGHWKNLSMDINNVLIGNADEFGVIGVEWPVLQGMQKLPNDALAYTESCLKTLSEC